MLARETVITVIDFESTRVVPGYTDEPWQVGLVCVERGRLRPASRFSSLLRVGSRPFSRHAPGRHAALRGEIARAPALADLWPQMRARLEGGTLGAHNAATEKKILRRAFPLHHFGPWVDTLKLVRMAYPALASHKLDDLLPVLGLQGRAAKLAPRHAPHDALFDAISAGLLLEHLMQLPGWEVVTVAALAAARPAEFHARVAARRPRRLANRSPLP